MKYTLRFYLFIFIIENIGEAVDMYLYCGYYSSLRISVLVLYYFKFENNSKSLCSKFVICLS